MKKIRKYIHQLNMVRQLSTKNGKLRELGQHLDSSVTYKATVSGIKTMSTPFIRDRLSEITFDYSNLRSDINTISAVLKKKGIIIIERFLDDKALTDTQTAIDEITKIVQSLNPVDFQVNVGDTVVPLQTKRYKRFSGYNEMANSGQPIITVRGERDSGMVDVFNVDLLPISEKKRFESLAAQFSNKDLLRVVAQYNSRLQPANLNLYLNRGITKTRGPHFDDLYGSLKGFLYLSDVDSLHDGPYCYAPGTNAISNLHAGSVALNPVFSHLPTDCNLTSADSFLPILAKKGTLILSDQTGIHFGFPQSIDGRRNVGVMRYSIR